jgi:hypothetical protein
MKINPGESQVVSICSIESPTRCTYICIIYSSKFLLYMFWVLFALILRSINCRVQLLGLPTLVRVTKNIFWYPVLLVSNSELINFIISS